MSELRVGVRVDPGPEPAPPRLAAVPDDPTDDSTDAAAVYGSAPPGTAASFEVLYRAEYGRMLALATVLGGDRHRAEELVQDAFLSAHRRWDEVGAYDRPGAWVRRVVVHRATDRRRRLRREAAALLRLRTRPSHDHQDPAVDDEVWAAVRALPRRQAQVVVLYYLDDRSTAEVADVLGMAEGTVRAHLAAARRTLGHDLAADSAELTELTDPTEPADAGETTDV